MLKEQRKKKGITQEELAEKTGISVYTIKKYEQGQRDINICKLENLLKLCKVLECSIEDILTDMMLIEAYHIQKGKESTVQSTALLRG